MSRRRAEAGRAGQDGGGQAGEADGASARQGFYVRVGVCACCFSPSFLEKVQLSPLHVLDGTAPSLPWRLFSPPPPFGWC